MAVRPVHIDINQQIQDWKEARYGRQVRSANVEALTELQNQMNGAVDYIIEKGVDAEDAALHAETAAANTTNVKESTEALRLDLQSKLESDYWRGNKGDKGDKGDKGESGVTAPSAGMFSLYLDPTSGNLYADYPDGSVPPMFDYDQETGNLYYVTSTSTKEDVMANAGAGIMGIGVLGVEGVE